MAESSEADEVPKNKSLFGAWTRALLMPKKREANRPFDSSLAQTLRSGVIGWPKKRL